MNDLLSITAAARDAADAIALHVGRERYTYAQIADLVRTRLADLGAELVPGRPVPLERLEEETVQWAREILALSPTALRLLKAAFNADVDGLAGIQQLAGDATLLFYLSEEAKEGRNAYLEKRKPDFDRFPRLP